MATSLVAQLQRLAVPDAEPRKRPFTRPSILFDPKEAADIELDTILNIARSGLEVLISIEERFNKYKNDLFSYGSRELDRELMGIEENNRINASIYSYLHLLSGYLEFSAALKTLEYLIRRYKIHIYNIEEFILCALPYHDTHLFVRVVQLIDTGNTKWKFLEGVKNSGAPLPRNIIVQQSIRDMGILEVLCNYVATSKKIQPSRPVTGFCTAVIFEVLGSLTTIDSEAVRRVLPFVEFGLQPGSGGGTDQKAGALMIVSLLADKVALSPKVVKSLIRSLAEVARADARDSIDSQWCRMSLMTLITLVQLQSVEIIPKKIIDILKDIRGISGLLSELVEEFNAEKFLALFLDSLIDYSYDDLCHGTLLSIVEMVPLKDFIARIVSKLLNTSLRILKENDSDSAGAGAGSRCNQILDLLLKKYLFESREAVNRYIEDIKLRSKKDYEIVIRMLNCNLALSHELSNSKIWFAMEHPKAEVRRSALLGLDVRGMLNVEASGFQRFGTIQDAILRRLCDEDLTVVQAALNLEALPEIISAPLLIDAFKNVLQRCINILSSGASRGASLAVDIALSCLQHAAAGLPDEGEHVKIVASLVFPFIIIIPKTQRLNLKALEMAKQMKWPFYEDLVGASLLDQRRSTDAYSSLGADEVDGCPYCSLGAEEVDRCLIVLEEFCPEKSLNGPPLGKLDSGKISSINAENINVLAKTLSTHPEEHLPWLVECCKTSELSKTLFLLVLLQSFTLLETGDGQFSAFFGICFPILQMEWELLKSSGSISEEFNPGLWEGDINRVIEHMVATNPKALDGEILTCLFWRLLGSFSKIAAETESLDKNEDWLCCFRDLFVFIVSRMNHAFKKHLCNVVAKCKIQTSHFLSEFFTNEGVSAAVLIGSLQVFTSLCARPDESLTFQLFAEFPSILVPLSSDNQDVRTAAMNTIEGLLSLWSRINLSRSRNGLQAVWVHFLGELLGLMVQQKRLLISDKNVLSSLFSSLLGNSNDSLLVQHNIRKRFDQSTKDEILTFLIGSALGFSAYAKLKILSLLKGVGDRVLHVNGIKSLMLDLLDRRQKCHIGFDKSCHKLSQVEVTILCLLLEMCIKPSIATAGDLDVLDPILKALQVSDAMSEDPAVLKPCLTVLGDLTNSFYASLKTETQDLLFWHLVLLFRSTNGDIQKATREALLRISITCSVVSRKLEVICEQKVWSIGSRHDNKRKKRSACNNRDVCLDIIPGGGNVVAFVGSLLDVLLLKKDMENRASLICPLFKLLQNAFFDDEWIHVAANQGDLHYLASSENSQRISDAAIHIQQELLLILEDITASVTSEDTNSMNFDVELLIKCARSVSNMVTRNQIFSLLSAISRAEPDKVIDHILEILVVIGESAVSQWDSNFQHIFEDLISAVVPCWLSKTDSAESLLQIFVNILPQVSENRRISMIVHVLRHLGESVSLGSLLYLLFRSLVVRNCSSFHDRNDPSFSCSISLINTQWEYLFAVNLLEKYSCTVWLPSILMLLQRIVVSDSDATLFTELLVAMHFISNKLQDPEIAFKLDSGEDSDNIQLAVAAIMKEIVCHLQLVDSKRKQIGGLSVFRKELKEYMNTVLSAVTKRLTPSVYFKAIVQLLGHVDKCVRRKALGTLSEKVKDTAFVGLKHEKRGPTLSSKSLWFHLDEISLQSLDALCLEILKIVNSQSESSSLKLAAVSALEVLANRFPSDNAVFSVCLDSICKSICTDNSILSSSCLRTAGALINVLGPKALPQLPFVMEGMIRKSRSALPTVTAESKQTDGDASIVSSIQNHSVFMSILLALEAVVNKLGGFLNPYLGDIMELMLLKPQYTSTSELKLRLKADSVRKLITERVPVRLLLSPLLRAYSDAITCGDSSVSIAFEMIQNLVAAMDRSSVGAYHVRIFDMCLQALDLRRQHPASVRNVDAVEKNVIATVVALTMKLTEKMFKPLFMRSIEWSESIVEENENAGTKSIDRSIAFYGLVNSLAESQRSLFVPNFKYLLDGCVRYLMDAEGAESALNPKKKKVKLQESSSKKDTDGGLSIGLWHLRALILSSLHKSFLYDTGTLKFLDSANFQVLLKPIVSQLVTDPPVSLVQYPDVPSVEEVDDILVECVGRMAVTAGSDLLWKPLNHEVLMQTRSEKLRSRILGLRIVKYMVENLKEEYLVLLAETIPFLGELLEDVELPVKSLAQEILKEMESMSGESLRQYL